MLELLLLSAPTRGDFLPVLVILIPLDVLLILAAPLLFFVQEVKVKGIAHKIYFYTGILTCILGIGLLLVPLFLFASYAYSHFTGTNPQSLSWDETLLPSLLWIAIPGVPLLLGDVLLRIAARLDLDQKTPA